jgi:uncharacterized repeat protein (TIGR01451 family)
MRKFLNISFLIMALSLCGSFSCESWRTDQQTGFLEPDYSEDFFVDEEPEAIGGAPVEMTSTLIQEQQPAPVRSELMAVSESGSSIVSRAYPWPECGVVQLDKTMPKEVGLNRAFNYSIKVTNLTDTRLTDIVITEELPGNFRFISANPTAKEDMDKLIWELDMLGPKASKQLTVSGMATYSDTLKYCTTIITPVIPACTSVEVIQPRLKLVKTAPAEVLLCDSIPTKFVVTNAGTGSVPNVKIVETLPPGLRTTDGKSQLVFEAGTLMAGQSRQFSTELRATKAGTYISKAVASSASGLRAESAETTTVVGLPVLTIRKTGFERQYIGRPINYEITVTNKSDVSAKNTVIEDTIPDGVDSVKATAGAKLSGSKLVWEIGNLAPEASKKVVVSYTPNSAGTLMSSATVTAYCTETVTDSVRTIVTGIPAVLLEVVDVEDPVRIGSRATYVIRVTNQGSATATNIRITCILEDNVRYISSAGATASSIEGDTIRFIPLSNLAPKAKAAWRVVVEAVKPGDMRFKVIMNADQLTRPVEETESTHLYD